MIFLSFFFNNVIWFNLARYKVCKVHLNTCVYIEKNGFAKFIISKKSNVTLLGLPVNLTVNSSVTVTFTSRPVSVYQPSLAVALYQYER